MVMLIDFWSAHWKLELHYDVASYQGRALYLVYRLLSVCVFLSRVIGILITLSINDTFTISSFLTYIIVNFPVSL